mgnify:CR=1 FL=1
MTGYCDAAAFFYNLRAPCITWKSLAEARACTAKTSMFCALKELHRKSMEGLEWLVENSDDVVVCGLMVREFGPKADEQIHGELVRKVRRCGEGPEYHCG